MLNILIPSDSGQAATTISIMASLADMLDITRQTALIRRITAYKIIAGNNHPERYWFS